MAYNLHSGTSDIQRWRSETRPSIRTADWLTTPLVRGGILPEQFLGARVAPIAVGLGFAGGRSARQGKKEVDGVIKTATGIENILRAPTMAYSPHASLKGIVRDTLTSHIGKSRKPDITIYPGYVFPDINGGALYLDSTLEDTDCTVEKVTPAAEILAEVYDLGTICVGSEAVVVNAYSHIPAVSLPSVIRQGLMPESKQGGININPQRFARAAAEVTRFAQMQA